MSGSARSGDWLSYYQATAGRPPRPTLLQALQNRDPRAAPGHAIDLGCGDGRDTIELLRRGWTVLAIDSEAAALDRLKTRPDLPPGALLTTLCGKFEEVAWPPSGWPPADLINASFALPICPPASFPALWQKLTAALAPGGRFAGQLYGDRDSWAHKSDMTFHDAAAVRQLLTGYVIERLDEEESDAVTPRGEAKHWHIFHIVARKRDPT